MEEEGSQHRGDSPTLLKKRVEFFKVPCIGSVNVERLDQWLYVPTQGQRVAQTGDERPFSLRVLVSDPSWESNLGHTGERLMHYQSAT